MHGSFPLRSQLRTLGYVFALCQVFLASLHSIAYAEDLFPDKNLEAAVRREVFEKRYKSDPITIDDVKNISQVVGKGKGIKSLEGLQHCKSLMKLDLENNEIVDLNPIRELKQLQSIDLSSNKIASIEPMSQLVNSQYLQLSNNAIEDLTPLSGMTNLQSLYIAGNKIRKLEPIAKHKKLQSLDVSGSPIEDLDTLGQLRWMQTLNLKGCGIKNLEFARSLTELKLLILNDNPITDFGALADACESDAKGENRFAPFLKLYIDDSVLKESSAAAAMERLRAVRVRFNPSTK